MHLFRTTVSLSPVLLASVEALTHIVHLLSPCVNYAARLG
jgi:hypothetical protein